MSKAPAFQFYPSDWMRDTRQLSLAARGAWADLLCAMWWAEDRGKITRDIEGFSREIACTPDEAEKVIIELIEAGVIDAEIEGVKIDGSVTEALRRNGKVTERHKKVTLISRRMVREHNAKKANAIRQARHRSNAYSNAKVTPLSSTSTTTTSSSSSNLSFMDRERAEKLEHELGADELEKAVAYCERRKVKNPYTYINGCLKNDSRPWNDEPRNNPRSRGRFHVEKRPEVDYDAITPCMIVDGDKVTHYPGKKSA